MGTVGLSFGSAASGTGFDVTTTVASILAIQQGIETPWKNQNTKLQAQNTALTALGTDLSALSTKLQALTDFQGVLAQKLGASSDPNTIALNSANATAIAGNHDITVQTLAQTSSEYTSPVASTDVLSGSISLQVGAGATHTIPAGTDGTIAGLAAAINAAGIGVSASILQDSSGSRLSLVSATSGAAGQLTIGNSLTNTTTPGNITVQAGHTGRDAALTVDGVALTSASNTVSNAIPGVAFQLLNTSSTAVQVQITNNDAAIATAVSDFSVAYNTVVKDLAAQEGKDSSGNAKPLFGDPTIALLQSELSSALLVGGSAGGVDPLTQLGLSLNADGTLQFVESNLTTELASNFAGVQGLLQNAGGFGSSFTQVLGQLGDATPQGALYIAEQQNTTQETTLTKDVSDEEARLATQKTTLTKELNLANQILQAIPSQLNAVSEEYSAVTGYNTTTTQ